MTVHHSPLHNALSAARGDTASSVSQLSENAYNSVTLQRRCVAELALAPLHLRARHRKRKAC